MQNKKAIRITSMLGTDFETEVAAGKEKYLVQTEDRGEKNPIIITRVYLNGQILLTKKTDYAHIIDAPDRGKRLLELMQKQHRLAVNTAKAGKLKESKTVLDYLESVNGLLKNNNNRSAVRLLGEALEQHPDDPLLLSYYGCLDAVVNKNYRHGIETCLFAIETLKKKLPSGEDFFSPVYYLNLGRAYLAAGRKNEAIDTFYKGMGIDRKNKDLRWEIRKLGVRRMPPLQFLPRSSPINKYIGKMLHSLKK